MTSPLPPRRRDSRNLADLIRQNRTNLKQLAPGFVGGRFPPARLRGHSDGDDGDDEVDEVILFENADRKVASGPGTQTFTLSHQPLDGSLHVRWNGVDQPPSEWTLTDSTVTLTDPLGIVEAGDVFSAAYAYVDEDDAPIPVGFRAKTANVDGFSIPGPAVVGDLLIAAAMVTSSKSVTLNGWTQVGESAAVTHSTSSGSYTFRLVILAKIYDGTPIVPTISVGLPQSVNVVAAFDGGATVSALFATVADGVTASTPAGPSSLRVWGALSNTGTITPAAGTVIAYVDGFDIDITMTADTETATRSATSTATAGWCLATLAVYE